MITSNLARIKLDREKRLGARIRYEDIIGATGLASSTIARLLAPEPVERVDGRTLSLLCKYFECGVGDILEYTADPEPTSGT